MSANREIFFKNYKFIIDNNKYKEGFYGDEKISKPKYALCNILKDENSDYNENWSCVKLLECLEKVNQRPKKIDEIRKIISKISTEKTSEDGYSFTQQREIINQIFKDPAIKWDLQSIMLRLIVIDSLYSTNAEYSYFSFWEMAKEISELGGSDDEIQAVFNSIVDNSSQITANKTQNDVDLFSKPYGIRKNCNQGSRQTSLMSKYANYTMLQNPEKYPLGFPIYDSLAIKMYPKVCNLLAIKSKFTKSDADNNELKINEYISALNELRGAIFGNDNNLYKGFQQYDLLDAYLWRMGKIDNGNYSLLFNRKDYENFITNIGLYKIEDEELYKRFGTNGLDLVKKKQNNKNQDIYEYDFNKLVRHQCLKIEVDEILENVTNKDNMAVMISHWKKLYANLK